MNQIGRNDPCPCGSGKKYKQCCSKNEPGGAKTAPSSLGSFLGDGSVPIPAIMATLDELSPAQKSEMARDLGLSVKDLTSPQGLSAISDFLKKHAVMGGGDDSWDDVEDDHDSRHTGDQESSNPLSIHHFSDMSSFELDRFLGYKLKEHKSYIEARRSKIKLSFNASIGDRDIVVMRVGYDLVEIKMDTATGVIFADPKHAELGVYVLYCLYRGEGPFFENSKAPSVKKLNWWERPVQDHELQGAPGETWTPQQMRSAREIHAQLQRLHKKKKNFSLRKIHVVIPSGCLKDCEAFHRNSKSVNAHLEIFDDVPFMPGFKVMLQSSEGDHLCLFPLSNGRDLGLFPEAIKQWAQKWLDLYDSHQGVPVSALGLPSFLSGLFDAIFKVRSSKIEVLLTLARSGLEDKVSSLSLTRWENCPGSEVQWSARGMWNVEEALACRVEFAASLPKLDASQDLYPIGHSLYLNPKKGILYLTSILQQVDYVEDACHLGLFHELRCNDTKQGEDDALEHLGILRTNTVKGGVIFRFCTDHMNDASVICDVLERQSGRPLNILPYPETISPKLYVGLETKAHERLSLGVTLDEDIHLSGFPFDWKDLIPDMGDGLLDEVYEQWMFLDDDNDNEFQSDILYHEGFNWMVHLTIWRLGTLGKHFDDGEQTLFLEIFWKIVATILPEGVPPSVIEESFVKLILDHVKKESEPHLYRIFLNGGCCSFDVNGLYYPVLLALAKIAMGKHGEKIFLKRKTRMKKWYSIYEDDFEIAHRPELDEPNLTGPNIYPHVLADLPPNIDIYIDGEPLENLVEDDVKTLLGLSEREDWFDLNPKVFFKGEEIDIEEALTLTEGTIVPFRGKMYRIDQRAIPSLKWLNRLWNQLQGSGNSKKGSRGDGVYPVPRSSSLDILAMRSAGIEVNGGDEWDGICREFDALAERRESAVTPDFPHLNIPLKEHQKVGLQWMLDLRALSLGGILADDMGLGKTLQVLSFLEELRNRNELKRALVVVPTSLVYNWKSERDKFTPELPIDIFTASEKEVLSEKLDDPDHQSLLICSYGLFQRHGDFFQGHKWSVVFFDEAQTLKNIRSQKTTEARKLMAQSKFCITGTPMENHYGEFFSLIDLVVPGALGTYAEFMKSYGPKRGAGGSAVDPTDLEFLRLKTTPLVLRRTKEAILKDLPPKTENVLMIPFEKKQKAIYKDIAISWNDKIQLSIEEKGEDKSQLEILTAMLRLRQACSCPASLPNIKYTKTPPKIELLVEQVEALLDKGESVLVFTNFVSTLNHIMEIFEKHHHTALSIHGSMSAKQRSKVLETFDHSEKANLLIMTLKTGGVGLNLTKARHVFHLEPWWNPASENQGTDRVHRMGQTGHVHVVRMIMEDSIEENIQAYKLKKSEIFDALFSESEQDLEQETKGSFARQKLTQKDFQTLLNIDGLKS